ncbi:MAG: putative mitochondrial protein, conserved [Bathelium mastoideum]|nr:MAG: putative mitochondrial protein, conserved [Bathelium mastoideum]
MVPRSFSLISRRAFTTSLRPLSAFSPGPSPPRLPKEEQEIFDRLQQQSTGAFSTPRTNTSATDPAPSAGGVPSASRPQVNQSPAAATTETTLKAEINARGEGEELHPDVRRGAAPEFKGDVNPRTGEVGGPKNEPLRWGGQGDWSYNGRVTDF